MLTSYAASFLADGHPTVSVSEVRDYSGEPKLIISDEYQNITLMFKSREQLTLLRDAINKYMADEDDLKPLTGSPVTRGELD